jgi:hypothetical protein
MKKAAKADEAFVAFIDCGETGGDLFLIFLRMMIQ